ncbi:MAG: hydrogenase iron-sulfur subunit [Desulfarculus sp.]|nr:MAG: hydrogenase iron-sulfur subunit [Desulfarculus sp.]
MSQPAKVGVFLCQGGRQAADSLEFKQLRWTADAAVGGLVFELPQTCQAEGAAAIARLAREHGLEAAVVGACPLLKNPGLLSGALRQAGLDPDMALVLDLCQKPAGRASGTCQVAPGAQAALSQALCSQAFRHPLASEGRRVATRVLVVGDGLTALLAARGLAAAGYPVSLLTPVRRLAPPAPLLGPEAAELAAALAREVEAASGVELLRQGQLLSLSGGAGDFRAQVRDRGGEQHQLTLGAVLMAQGPPQALNLAGLGLPASERVLGLSQFLAMLAAPEHLKKRFGGRSLRVGFLVGLARQAEPLATRAACLAAQRVAVDPQARVVLFTGNAKVAGSGLEALTQQVRGQGVVMVKFSAGGLSAQEAADGISVTWDEEVLDSTMSQEFDLLVVDETPAPDAAYQRLARVLGLTPGRDGYLQPDQVAALPVQSRRGGVLLLGPARGQGEPERWQDEVAEALLETRKLLQQGEVCLEAGRVQVDRRRCTICLTCVRVCPRGAMGRLERRPVYNPLVCTACGTCAAECPMEAIQLVGLEDERFQAEIGAAAGRVGDLGQAGERSLLVFLCANSAAQAFRAARLAGAEAPPGARLVEVPCAGKLDPDMVLAAFRRGFDGVLVLSCFPDACHSLTGSTWAGYRAGHLQSLLREAGLEPQRLVTAGVAPSQAREVMSLMAQAQEAVAALGPSPLKVGAQVRELLGRYTLEVDETYAIIG